MNILHITTHMGGGVGKVLAGISSYAQKKDSAYHHKILLLEKPEKMNFIEICRRHHVDVAVANNKEEILSAMDEADIVQVEWWHHPMMCGWLADFPSHPMRLVIWSHISGCFYPYIPPALLHIPQKFIFTSYYSLDNPYWEEETRTWARKSCAVVNSSGGFDDMTPRTEKRDTDIFCVGYMGTQSFSKMHPDYMEYCHAIQDIDGVQFRLVGDRSNEKVLLEQARTCGMEDKVHFVGYVNDVEQELSHMDVFGYLLNPTHFGTTENALLEAMALELPVVCLNQCAEKYLVQHGKTGLLVNGVKEYERAVRYLYSHPEERKRLGRNAREYVLKNFSVEHTVNSLHGIYDQVMLLEKRVFDFRHVFGTRPYEFFLSCLTPDWKENFSVTSSLPYILREENKSSLHHFSRMYPEDQILRAWKMKLQSL